MFYCELALSSHPAGGFGGSGGADSVSISSPWWGNSRAAMVSTCWESSLSSNVIGSFPGSKIQ